MKKFNLILVLLVFGLIMFISGCGSSSSGGGTQVTAIYVESSVITEFGGTIHVNQNNSGGAVITDATVTVNGVNFPFNPVNNTYHKWQEGFHVNAGDTVTVTVSWNGMTVTGQGTMPYPATITSPISDSSHNIASATDVAWNFGSNPLPGYIEVSGTDPYYGSDSLPGNSVNYTIPANTFTVGDGGVWVYAYNDGYGFTGPAGTGSDIITRQESYVAVVWTN